MTSSMTAHTQLLHSLFEAALDASDPAHCVPNYLPSPVAGKTVVIGAGRCATAMAQALQQHWPDTSLSGLIITHASHPPIGQAIDIWALDSPAPSPQSVTACQALLDRVQGLTEIDQVIILLSPGSPEMLSLPFEDLTVSELQHLQRTLVHQGASTGERHCVLKHLSSLGGGRLALACAPARVTSLVISDSQGDESHNLDCDATLGDHTSSADALAILAAYNIALPKHIDALLHSDINKRIEPNDSRLARSTTRLIASPQLALEAASKRAHALGIKSLILSDSFEGEATAIGAMMGSIARHIRHFNQPFTPPCILLSGGNTTVHESTHAATGPNVEFLLALALSLQGCEGISAIACDSNGQDGDSGCAGAIITELSLNEAQTKGLNATQHLASHDTHAFFSGIGQAVVTGPTNTDVNDFRAIFIDER